MNAFSALPCAPVARFPAPGQRRGENRRNEAQRLFSKALLHHAAGEIAFAIGCYEQALRLSPDFPEALNNLGVALAAHHRLEDAIARYRRALRLRPDYADACSNLAVALAAQGKPAEAVTCYQRALVLKPGHPDIHYNLGIALAALGRVDEAIAQYQHALKLKPASANIHNNLGNLLETQNNPEAAFHYEYALAINPNHSEAHNNTANLRRDQGQFDEAIAHYNRAISIRPGNVEAHYNRAQVKFFRGEDADLAALEKLAAQTGLPADEAVFAHFALAKALEDCGDYQRAFAHLRTGNQMKRARVGYDEPAMARLFQRIKAVFGAEVFSRYRGQGDPSSIPVFVLGMPRSGSTLIEQILASHPQIHAAGELNVLDRAAAVGKTPFPESLRSLDGVGLRRMGASYVSGLPRLNDGQIRVVDKLPRNFLYIGLIRLILPNARIIHTVRDPVDTCVSCYSKLFTTGQHFSYDLGELGRYYRRYDDLMNHWRSVLPQDAILDIAYEDVVNDLPAQARRLVDFCGLAWDERCISFHKTNRSIRTASAVQVRKPLFRTSLERWRAYEFGIGTLLRELGELVPPRSQAAHTGR